MHALPNQSKKAKRKEERGKRKDWKGVSVSDTCTSTVSTPLLSNCAAAAEELPSTSKLEAMWRSSCNVRSYCQRSGTKDAVSAVKSAL